MFDVFIENYYYIIEVVRIFLKPFQGRHIFWHFKFQWFLLFFVLLLYLGMEGVCTALSKAYQITQEFLSLMGHIRAQYTSETIHKV